MKEASKSFDFTAGERVFTNTFLQLATIIPDGIVRPTRRGITPLNLFEAVAVGAALAIQKKGRLVSRRTKDWLGSEELRELTTGATNSAPMVAGRIEFCRDRFLGAPHVPSHKE